MPSDVQPAGDWVRDTQVEADPDHPGRFRTDVPESWNVFSLFGGVSFGVALRAAQAAVGRDDLRPVSASGVFVAPVPSGPLTLDTDVLRDGRTGSQVTVDLRVGDSDQRAGGSERDGVALRLNAMFGVDHDSPFDFQDAEFPAEAGQPDDWDPPPPREPDDPFAELNYHKQTDWRPCIGQPPWELTRAEPARAAAWLRVLKEPTLADGTIDPLVLCCYGDALGPAVGQAIGHRPQNEFFFVTLDLSIRFVATPSTPWALQYMRAWECTAGYSTGTCELWGEDRRLLGIAIQTARLRQFTG